MSTDSNGPFNWHETIIVVKASGQAAFYTSPSLSDKQPVFLENYASGHEAQKENY